MALHPIVFNVLQFASHEPSVQVIHWPSVDRREVFLEGAHSAGVLADRHDRSVQVVRITTTHGALHK